MDIGIPKEVSNAERRIALAPFGVRRLVQTGHRVYVERGAGLASRFGDDEYLAAGAILAYDAEEAYSRADLVLKVAAPTPEEYPLLHEEQTLMCFLVPVVAPSEAFRLLLDRRVTAVAMELIEDDRGRAPILESISEIAGPMSIHIAAHLLESDSGGRGILLGGAPGVPPASVVILGAGVVGTTAARTALGNGAHVTVFDKDLPRLRRVEELFWRRATTQIMDEYHLAKAVQFADVLIGAVLIRAERTPHLVSEMMVRTMKPGSVIIDISIDQGGCVETIRPTTLVKPTFVYRDVVHYAVPNLTANVARTATVALTNACLPYVHGLATDGLAAACAADPGLAHGVVTSAGLCFHRLIAEHFRLESHDFSQVLGPEGSSDVRR